MPGVPGFASEDFGCGIGVEGEDVDCAIGRSGGGGGCRNGDCFPCGCEGVGLCAIVGVGIGVAECFRALIFSLYASLSEETVS